MNFYDKLIELEELATKFCNDELRHNGQGSDTAAAWDKVGQLLEQAQQELENAGLTEDSPKLKGDV